MAALCAARPRRPFGVVRESSMPALGYAGTYAFANVLLTVAGTIIMTL